MYSPGNPKIPERTAPVPQGTAGSAENLCSQTPRLRRHGCLSASTPGNRPRSTASALCNCSYPSRSSAARANPLILRVFHPHHRLSRCRSVSTAEPVFVLTPDAVDCLSRPVCARTRSPSPSAPLAPWKRCMLSETRACTGRVPVQTHACDFRDLADSKVRRKVRRTAIPWRKSSSLYPTAGTGGRAR